MTGAELSEAIAVALFAAAMVGWLLHWVWSLLARIASSERGKIKHLVRELDTAERAREAAEAALRDTEARLRTQLAELEQTLRDRVVAYDIAMEAREADAASAIAEAKREAEAAWDGLGNARRRIAELERIIAGLREARGESHGGPPPI